VVVTSCSVDSLSLVHCHLPYPPHCDHHPTYGARQTQAAHRLGRLRWAVSGGCRSAAVGCSTCSVRRGEERWRVGGGRVARSRQRRLRKRRRSWKVWCCWCAVRRVLRVLGWMWMWMWVRAVVGTAVGLVGVSIVVMDAEHLRDWFECPVHDCTCRCQSRDRFTYRPGPITSFLTPK